MPVSKKDKKNGKDSGGVVAAVTKAAPKFTNSNGNGIKGLSASPSPPPIQSPEFRATATSSHDIPVASPLLDAISTTSFATSNSPNTREWTKAVSAGMAGSPGNLISLVGESPPTAPSSYEEPRGINSGWSSPRPHHAPYHHPTSMSPPSAARRPLSFQMDGRYSPPDAHSQAAGANVAGIRRSSMHSHSHSNSPFAQVRGIATPPLPHQPQAHFYGAPDLDFDIQQPQSGMKAGTDGYHYGFDVLPTNSPDHVPGRGNVVLAGYEGGLEVYSVSKKGMERLAGLKGLRGGVHHAKILPWTASTSDLYPLVALVIHGPNLPAPPPGINLENDYDAVSQERSEGLVPPQADAASRDGMGSRMPPGFVDSYQTTVEVYSLKTGKLVSPLLEAAKISLKMPITSPIFKAPPPSGAFHIRADAGNLVVSSGISGECWIFRQLPVARGDTSVQFRCLGKIWTTLQQPLKGDSSQDAERGRLLTPVRPRPQSAILSINDRWIAYCPAAPSSPLSLKARVMVPALGKAPGLLTETSPQLPQVSSDVDLPLSESVMNKIMRDATQELIQGAKWVGKQGLQAWQNYWNPQAPQQQPRSPQLNAQGWGPPGMRSESAQFPPTHGASTVTPSAPKEPGLISILGVETLRFSASIHPVTTFAIPNGCSFLSFSPTGLSLFTASSKGDVQTIWDLMRIQHTKSSPLQSSGLPFSGGPRVRQVAQFSRMTVARIVAVSWTRPNGERIAMVTERGTVHLLDLPSSAFTWPPPRRRTQPTETKTTSEGPTASAVSIASNALNTVRGAARPLINRPRRSSSTVQQMTGAGIGDYAAHGSKVIAASISHSLGKTGYAINQLRQTGENRVALPNSSSAPGSSCVVWITGRKDHFLYVLGNGLVRTFPTKTRKTTTGADRRAPRLTRYKDFTFPYLPDDAIAPAVKAFVDPEEFFDLGEKDSDSGNNNTMVLDQRSRAPSHSISAESSIPQAEIESSAPYQPFHTDRRVGLFEVDSGVNPQDQPQLQASTVLLSEVDSMLSRTGFDGPPKEPIPASQKKTKSSKKSRHRDEDDELQQEQQPLQLPVPTRYSSTSPSTSAFTSTSTSPSPARRNPSVWAFGQPIKATRLDTGVPPLAFDEDFNASQFPLDESRALPASAIERVHTERDDQIVVTTRRRRGVLGRGAGAMGGEEDGFFEDDCEVLDFADQRV